MDFEEFYQKNITKINEELNKILAVWRTEISVISNGLLPLVDKFIDSCRGGKRIRGMLVVLGYEIGKESSVISPQIESSIIKIAAAYEIFHSAFLAHDDVIDQSEVRRGKPSLYKALGADHKGISRTICLGDGGFFLATRIIAESRFPDSKKNEVLKYLSGILLNTAIGQMLDVEKGDSLVVAKYKTAQYSVSGPLVLGATLAGAGEQWLKHLAKFGEKIGIAFQIKDDILDNEAGWIGGVTAAQNEADKYISQTKKMLPEITKDIKMRKLLQQMAEYLVERTK